MFLKFTFPKEQGTTPESDAVIFFQPGLYSQLKWLHLNHHLKERKLT